MSALREVIASFGVSFDDSGLKKGEKGVSSLVGKLKGVATAIAGAFVVKKAVDFGRSLVQQADHVGETADRLRVSTDALQEWQFAAKQSGIEADELTAAFSRLGAGIAEAAAGKGQAAAFAKLGVRLKNADGSLRSTTEVFEEAGVAIGGMPDQTAAAAIAADLFGKSYAKLIPLFAEGRDGLEAMRQEFREIGGGFSPEFIKQSQRLGDDMDKLTTAATSLGASALAPLVPAIVEIAEGLISLSKGGGGEFVSMLRDAASASYNVVRSLGVVGARTGALGAVFRGVGKLARLMLQPLFAAEDFFVFLAGGKSVLGEDLTKAFGPAGAEQMRQFFLAPLEAIGTLQFSLRELNFMLAGFGIASQQAGNALTDSFEGAAASISDAFDRLWNAFLEGAALAVKAAGRVASALPGGGEAEANAEEASKALLGSRRAPVAGAQAATAAAVRRQQLAALAGKAYAAYGPQAPATAGGGDAATRAAADAAQAFAMAVAQRAAEVARGGGPETPGAAGPATVAAPAAPQWLANTVQNSVDTKVTVNVPPGTDAEMAERVGTAAGKAVEAANLRAVKAAVVPGGP